MKIEIIKENDLFDWKVGDILEGLPNGKININSVLGDNIYTLPKTLVATGYAREVEERWKPKEGEEFWYLTLEKNTSPSVTVNNDIYIGGPIMCYETGNCYQTIEKACKVRDKIRKILEEEREKL